jgi:ferritin
MTEELRTPENQRKAIRKYLSKFKEVKLRLLPEEHEEIVAHAKEMGDKSTVAFISRAIHETMERDRQNKGDGK